MTKIIRVLFAILLILIVLLLGTLAARALRPGAPAGALWPSALPSASPSPPMAAPTPTATPTLTPAQHEALASALLREGLQLQSDGDYESAIGRLVDILTLHPTTSPAAEASYRLGECYLWKGELQLGLNAFQDTLRRYPDSPFVPQATFLAGSAADGLGNRQAAMSYYQEYARLRPSVSGYVALKLGDLYQTSGNITDALKAYEHAIQAELPPSQTADAHQRMAEIYAGQKDFAKAISHYQTILELARNPWYRSLILNRLGSAYVGAGQTQQARDAYLRVITDYPDAGNALASLQALDSLGDPRVDAFQRALVYFHAADYTNAIASWRRYIEAAPKGDGTAWARYYIGLSLQRQGDYRGAMAEYDTLVQRYPSGPIVAEARLAKARCLRLLGDETVATSEYLSTARSYPGSQQAQRGYWEAGIGLYRLGNTVGAISVWQELLASNPTFENRTRVLFWMGKAMLARGYPDDARRFLAEAASQRPPDHYALRAGDLMTSAVISGPPATATPVSARQPLTQPSPLLPDERLQVEGWVAGWAPPDPPRSGARERALGEPHFVRGQELASIHLQAQANEEFSLAQETLARDAWALLEMAYQLLDDGQTMQAVAAANKLMALSPARWAGEAPVAMQRLLYPVRYGSLLETWARRYGVDPLLLAALVRQESLFSPTAASSADARGLTQVIPSTAQAIASALGVSDFRLEDLYRPKLSLQFGAYYLAEMLRLAGGDTWMALASYNGGYGNAVRWAGGDRPIDPDLFLENVTFDETRTYLQSVARNYRFYRALYSTTP